jgi:hypothetical protein
MKFTARPGALDPWPSCEPHPRPSHEAQVIPAPPRPRYLDLMANSSTGRCEVGKSTAGGTGMRRIGAVIGLVVLALALGCREEGAVEKAGKKLDRALDDLTHPNEGPLEKLGRKTDEAFDNAKEAIEDATER